MDVLDRIIEIEENKSISSCESIKDKSEQTKIKSVHKIRHLPQLHKTDKKI